MRPTFDIVFALTGDVRRNSRALKQLHLLSDMGLAVRALSYGPPARDNSLSIQNVTLDVLPRPSGGGPRFFWQVHRQMWHAAMQCAARVYHASDLYTLGALARAASKNNARLVFDSRELYTHVASTAGRPWVRWAWRLIQQQYVPNASVVFTVSEPIAQRLVQDYKIPEPILLYNVPPQQHIGQGPSLRALIGTPENAVILLHQGSIQKSRGCKRLVDAMLHVQGGHLVFLGGGPLKPSLIEYVEQIGLTKCIHFLDAVSPRDLLPITATADVGITLLEDTCLNHRYALPNKLFEYIMAGVPVVASDLPEIARIVRTYDIGRVVNAAVHSDLVQTLQFVIDNAEQRNAWSERTGRVVDAYNWETASERFIEAYRKLMT